jgi:protein-L-isoaspartate(D-aspartate) O-methyltransferase
MVALQVAAAEISPADRVLEVGTGSGYQATILGQLAAQVVTVEIVAVLLERAKGALSRAGATNVIAERAGEVLGAPARAPFDAIVVAAGGPHVPRSLLSQLARGGRLVMPVGSRTEQQLVRARLTTHGVSLERLGTCVFVPLIGEQAWLPSARPSRFE